ncbi:MAG TPA: hypothetical protein VG346_08360 [Acidimicrobiales bacterium]|jgi:uncharacterized protein (TIGR03086 family)|nr:hypothetical protein [Acidimicrobiales bacterium]
MAAAAVPTVGDDVRLLSDYRVACDAFADAVRAVRGHPDAPTPAPEGSVHGVLDHVFGVHDSLLLEPLGVRPELPDDDPEARWAATVAALFPALERPGTLDRRALLVGIVTTDVLIHSWDLTRAVGADVPLDPELCQSGYDRALRNKTVLEGSGALGVAVAVPGDATAQDRLLGLFGRNPNWGHPVS